SAAKSDPANAAEAAKSDSSIAAESAKSDSSIAAESAKADGAAAEAAVKSASAIAAKAGPKIASLRFHRRRGEYVRPSKNSATRAPIGNAVALKAGCVKDLDPVRAVERDLSRFDRQQ